MHAQHISIVTLILSTPSMALTNIDRQKALRQLHSPKLRPQRLNDLLPITMRRQRPPRRAFNTVFRIQLHIQRINRVAPRGDTDPDAIRKGIGILVFGFIELEADGREVVELRDGVAVDFGLDAAFEDAVEEGVDVRFLGEVDKGFGVVVMVFFWR